MSDFNIQAYQPPASDGLTAAERMMLASYNGEGSPAPAPAPPVPAPAPAPQAYAPRAAPAPAPGQVPKPPKYNQYRRTLRMSIADGSIDHREFVILEQNRQNWGITTHQRDELLKELGWVGSWESPRMDELRKKIQQACAKGKPSQMDVRALEEFRMQVAITDVQRNQILRELKLHQYMDDFEFKENPGLEELREIIRVALADGDIGKEEWDVIDEVCADNRISNADRDRTLAEMGYKPPKPKPKQYKMQAPKMLSGPEDALFVDINEKFVDQCTNQVTIGHRSITGAPPSPTRPRSPVQQPPQVVQPALAAGYNPPPAPTPSREMVTDELWVNFRYDLYDCCGDMEVCCCGLFFPCCLFEQIVRSEPLKYPCSSCWGLLYGLTTWWNPLLEAPFVCIARHEMRQDLKLKSTTCNCCYPSNEGISADCWTALFCSQCSLIQQYRELQHQGLIVGGPCGNVCGSRSKNGSGSDPARQPVTSQPVAQRSLEAQLQGVSHPPPRPVNTIPTPVFDADVSADSGGYAPSNRGR